MKHFYSKIILLLLFTFTLNNFLFGQYIQVDTSLSKEQLIDKFIGTNTGCITISNINISGYNRAYDEISYGYFTKGTSSFDLSEGIILSTGKAKDAEGPNSFLQDFWGNNWGGDQDLIDILIKSNLPHDNILNATYLEFDFVSNLTTDQISFEYMFLSEEYQSSNCQYSDAFAFLIKKADNSEPYQNIALVPNTTIPVTSLTINGARDCPQNISYFGGFNSTNSPTNFNGQTKVLKANAKIVAGIKYHIKLVIADHRDSKGRYDSAVFLKAGSFIGRKSLGNNVLLCPGSQEIIDAQIANATYQWYKDGVKLENETSKILTVNQEGHYEVDITENNGCQTKGYIEVENLPEINLYNDKFSFCEQDITIDLANYTEQIIEDYNPSFMQAKFYSDKNEADNNSSNIISTIHLNSTSKSQTVYIWVKSGTCSVKIFPINFYLKENSVYDTTVFEVCDTNLDNQENIDLRNYLEEISTYPIESANFYVTENDAKNNINSISAQQIINSDKTFYARFNQIDYCETIAPLKFVFKQGKKSELLKDVTICSTSTTTLDAGTGFNSYLWSTGETTSSISNIPIGKYTVRLEYNGCFYVQEVNVLTAENPEIKSIDIQGSTVTVSVSGSTPPYYYSLDNGPFQSSPIFYKVDLGKHIISVKSSLNCEIISQEFSLIKLVNFISPNGDGKNDVLDYSQLRHKMNAKFLIYDRQGKLIFEGNETNQFIWDGKKNGFKLPASSYWYTIEWKETENSELQKFNNWILLKN